MASPEVRRGLFVYRDTLFVEVGDGKRHPRASASELKDLLLPKKGGLVKDQVAHWYEAQLIHYGLPRSKDKNTAKVRLTAALSTDGLKLPSDLVKQEIDMKKEYATALRKAKATKKKPSEPSNASTSKKRKATEELSTTISINDDVVEVKIDRTSKSAKVAPSKPAAKSSKQNPKPASPSKSMKTQTTPAAPSSTQSRPKQTARRSRPFHYPSSNSRPNVGSRPIVDHTPSTFDHDDDEDDEPPPAYESLHFNESPPVAHLQISGHYTIDTEQDTYDLDLRVDEERQQLWGTFEIGSMEGVILASDIQGMADEDTISFIWRAEDTYNRQYYCRRDQTGSIAFDGNGLVRGTFFGLMSGEDIEFGGRLVDEKSPDVSQYRYAWDKIPRMAYGRSNN
jgi:hypothetical protein